MDPASIAPELRERARKLPVLPIGSAPGRWFTRFALRLMPRGKAEGVTLEQVRERGLRVRVYRPGAPRSAGALLWVHGGGYVVGRAASNDGFCSGLARTLGILVVSVDYRLAPEHPFPAASDDCLAAWHWLQREAQGLGVDPARVVIGGQSAGGGLAAGLAQRIRDAGGTQPRGQWLFCPMLDDRTAARTELDAIGHPLWNNRANRAGWRSYLGRDPGLGEPVPYAVPARCDRLDGLPPSWVGVGDIDLFHDEDRAYALRLQAAGVETVLDVVSGAPHGFESWAEASEIAQLYLGRARAWLASALDRPAA